VETAGATEIVPDMEAELRKAAMETVQNAKAICSDHWVGDQFWLICFHKPSKLRPYCGLFSTITMKQLAANKSNLVKFMCGAGSGNFRFGNLSAICLI
jgi:hypothetical protein